MNNQVNEENSVTRGPDRDAQKEHQNRQRASLQAQLDVGTTHTQSQQRPDVELLAVENGDRDVTPARQRDRDAYPDGFESQFFTKEERDGERAVYADSKGNQELFRDTGDQMRTKDGNELAIKTMVETAKHRQWQSIDVKGSKDFKRDVWLEAQSRGIDVRGYKPTELDRQELENRQKVKATNTMDKTDDKGDPASHERAQSRAGVPEQREPKVTADKDDPEINKRKAAEAVRGRFELR